MSTDIYTQVAFQDGEGISHIDFNNLQKFLKAQLHDGLIQYLIGASKHTTIDPTNSNYDPEFSGQNGVDADTRWAYCLNPGQAFLRQGSANHKIQIAPGTLWQKIAATDGTEAKLIPYTFVGTEEFTLTNGDVTNPRVDLLQMKLEYVDGGSATRDFEDATTRVVTTTSMNTTRRVQCTLSVKTGTPGASPAYPTPDAGFVPVGAVVVGNGWTTAGAAPIFGIDTTATNNAVVHDQRMPIKVRAYRVDPSEFKLVTAWALSNNNSTVSSSNITNLLYVPCPVTMGRLVGVEIHISSALPATFTPMATAADVGQSTGILSTTYTPRNSIALAASPGPSLYTEQWGIESNHASTTGVGGVGPGIVANATMVNNLAYNSPIWCTGRRALYEKNRLGVTVGSANPDTLVLRVRSGSATTVMGHVIFYVAEGI